jgi:hypothetical protein
MMGSRRTPEQVREAIAARVAATERVLEAELARVVSGEDWVRFLAFAAGLHRYSIGGNSQLIVAQHRARFEQGLVPCPEPSFVAGFKTWEALGRRVEKGQHGYAILAPVRSLAHTAIDTDSNRRVLHRGEEPAPAEGVESRPVLRGWKVEHVWDATQTVGRPLPEAPRPQLLKGEAPKGLFDAVAKLVEGEGFRVGTVPDAVAIDGANGCTNWSERTVVVRSDMDHAAQAKTLVHDSAHILLHSGTPDQFLPRPLKEVEAESVAFVVAAAHGMRTDDYSFPYIATWAGGEGPKAVADTQARVARTASAIIAVSPAEHSAGGPVPGANLALEAARAARHAPAAATITADKAPTVML